MTSARHIRTLLGVSILTAGFALAGCAEETDPGQSCDGCGPGPNQPEPEATCVDAALPTDLSIVPIVEEGDTYVELLDGETLSIAYGSQGGTHLDVGADVFNPTGADLVLTFWLEGAGATVAGPELSTSAEAQSCDGQWRRTHARIFDPSNGAFVLHVDATEAGSGDVIASTTHTITVN